MGRDFSITLDMVSSAGDIELKTLIAQPMTVWLQQADKSYRPINGYIHTARRLGGDGSFSAYQLTFASWMHFLKFRSDMRYWQDKSADAVITDVFNQHPQARGQFQFALRKPLPARSYCRQSESDWNFVHRLLEQEGLYGFWRQAADGKSHTLVVTDDLHALDPASSGPVGFARMGVGQEPDAFTQWAGSRTLQSTAHTTRTFDYKAPSSAVRPKGTSLPTMAGQGDLPEQAEVYEYTGAYTYLDQTRGEQLSKVQLEEWESRAKRFFASGGVRGIDAGQRFTLTGHPEHDRDPAGQREFAAIKVWRYIENNLPLSDREASFPHSLQQELARAKGAHPDATVAHEDGSAGFYHVDVEAQRVTVPYRSPFEHKKPTMHLETAIVVGPKDEEVYTDALNRVRVMFVWDRQNEGDAGASCWLRVAQSDTGGGYGGVHIPRVGEEVLVGYVGGDCDRPVVLHRVYNGAAKPRWHSNGILSGYRSKEYGGSGYNQLTLDDATGQNRVHLYSTSADSHLHLGYLIAHTDNTRGAYLGSGFDLKSSAYGALRAGRGLYVSTHPATSGEPLDVRAAASQLANSNNVMAALSDTGVAHQAESLTAGREALAAFADATQSSIEGGGASGGRTAGGGTGSANGFAKPQLLMASPSGMALSTQQSVQVAADRQVNVVSGQSTHVATGKSLIASVTDKLSLFVQNAGMKLFAGKGKVEIQAQSDNLELTAQKTVKILSATQTIEVAAQQDILLTSGGAYLRISNGDIQIHAPGKIDIKGAQHAFEGPAQMAYPLPHLPVAAAPTKYSQRFDAKPVIGHGFDIPYEQIPYTVRDPAGKVVGSGMLDKNGFTGRVFTETQTKLKVYFGDDPWRVFADTKHST